MVAVGLGLALVGVRAMVRALQAASPHLQKARKAVFVGGERGDCQDGRLGQ